MDMVMIIVMIVLALLAILCLVNVRIPWTRVSLPIDLGVHRVDFMDGAFVLTDHTSSTPICGYAPSTVMEVVGKAYDRLEEVTENGGQDD